VAVTLVCGVDWEGGKNEILRLIERERLMRDDVIWGER